VIQVLKDLGVCDEAIAWMEGRTDPFEAWNECHRGDWLLWLLGTCAGPAFDRRRFVLCICDCVEPAVEHAIKETGRRCLAAARSWAVEECSYEELRKVMEDLRCYRNRVDGFAYKAATAVHYAAACASTGGCPVTGSMAVHNAAFVAQPEYLARCADGVRGFYPEPPEDLWTS
jgi:hypothetical protein